VPGKSTSALAEVARETGAIIIASLFEKRSAGVYHNTAAIIDANAKLLGKYRKMHIPDDPLYHEKFYFAPGDLGFQAWPTPQGKIGVCVCWDQWYPEAARLTALHGAELIFYPTAIGWHPSEKKQFGATQHSAWEPSSAVTQSRTDAMLVPNRVGHKRLRRRWREFWGQLCLGPTAKSSQGFRRPGRDCDCQVDWRRVEQRTHWPFLRDRRVDAYGEINRRLID
jgi:N-carbamoylputrescine amidase